MGCWIPITLSKALGFESHVLHAVVTVVALLCSLMCQLDISRSILVQSTQGTVLSHKKKFWSGRMRAGVVVPGQ